ncbi:MAG: hypothetical protein HFACDABA_01481 [Anaerolineales bacterium]|nr:hypothetical protein [Anaerolineales bacterium]
MNDPNRPKSRLRALHLAATVAVLFSACNAPSANDCARPDLFCVGFVTAFGTIDDHGLNQSAWEGVRQAVTERFVDRADFIETVDARDRAKNIASFAGAGYDLIVTIGYSIGEDTRLAADDWPDTRFLGVDQPQTESRPNLAAITFPEDQGGFLAGVIAASATKTGRVAAVCEVRDIPEMWRACEGFRAGVHYASADALPRVVFHPDHNPDNWFNDPVWGAEQASINARIGMDVLFAAGGNSALGALDAATEEGLYIIGTDEDVLYQVKTPDRVIASVVKDVRSIVYTLTLAASQGQLPGGDFGGAYALAEGPGFARLILPSLQGRIEQIQRGLSDGSIQTNVPREP